MLGKSVTRGDTWHIMLHGLARRSEWVVGHEVLRDMQGSGVKMTDWLENAAEEVARGYIACYDVPSPRKKDLLKPTRT